MTAIMEQAEKIEWKIKLKKQAPVPASILLP